VASFHAVKANFNWLFRQNNKLFFKKLEKDFETNMLLLFGLNLSPAFPKTQFCDARIVSRFD